MILSQMSDRAFVLFAACHYLAIAGAPLEKPLQELTGFLTREAALAYLVNGIE